MTKIADRKLRVCFITPEYPLLPPFGGIATATHDAAHWLADHDHEVHVITVSRTAPRESHSDGRVQLHIVRPRRIRPRTVLKLVAGIPGLSFLKEAYCGWNLLEDSRGAWGAVRELSSVKAFDVVEVSDTFGLGVWGELKPRRRSPILVRSHGYTNLKLAHVNWCGAKFQYQLERYSVRHADFVLAVSEERVRCYRSELSVPEHKIASLHLGIDTKKSELRMMPADGSGNVTALYLGSIDFRKGCDVLFQAARRAHQEDDRLRLVLVGPVSAQIKEPFERFLQDEQSWVNNVGPVQQEETRHYLAMADMLLLPSRFETLPRVLIEALAAGVPQIATRVNGIPEIVDDGVTGLLVDPDDIDGLTRALLKLAGDSSMRERMSTSSRMRANERFELDRIMTQQVDTYERLRETYSE